MNYENYFDKVYGCWMGKCVSGNIGAPYEGMKQKLDLEYSPDYLNEMLPNDDLDLQVLWLEVVRKKGRAFTSEDLAAIFNSNCDYAPGEYAFFKKNYRRGIMPPYSGSFNNSYYSSGMGAPIRSEIWACLAPGDPELACEYADRDSVIDHAYQSESFYGERFYAALESLAFTHGNIKEIISKAGKYVSEKSRLYALVSDVPEWCEGKETEDEIRKKIIRDYGNVEATDCLQNTGFILMSLLRGGGDFLKSTMLAVNCGFDTDCTGATTGAVLGILNGAKKLKETCGFQDGLSFKLGVRSSLSSDKVIDFARSVAETGAAFCAESGKAIRDVPFAVSIEPDPAPALILRAEYRKEPAIGFGETLCDGLSITNNSDADVFVRLSVKADGVMKAELKERTAAIGAHESVLVDYSVSVEENEEILPDSNKVVFVAETENGTFSKEVGYAGKKRYLIAGPFWKNIIEIPKLKNGESYWGYFKYDKTEELMDAIRHYHMNSLPADEKIDIKNIDDFDYKSFDVSEDKIELDRYVGFTGQAAYLLVTDFFSEKSFTVSGLQMGYTDAFRFYLNGTLLAERSESNMFTPENIHIFDVKVKKGANRVAVVLNKYHRGTEFSFNFLSNGVTSDHITFAGINVKKLIK